MRGRDSLAAIQVYVFVCSPLRFAIGSPRPRLRVARSVSLIPETALSALYVSGAIREQTKKL